MSHVMSEEEIPTHKISFVIQKRVGKIVKGRGNGLVPPGFLVNWVNTVFDHILVLIIQHRFALHAYNSLFLNRGTGISYVLPTNQNISE